MTTVIAAIIGSFGLLVIVYMVWSSYKRDKEIDLRLKREAEEFERQEGIRRLAAKVRAAADIERQKALDIAKAEVLAAFEANAELEKIEIKKQKDLKRAMDAAQAAMKIADEKSKIVKPLESAPLGPSDPNSKRVYFGAQAPDPSMVDKTAGEIDLEREKQLESLRKSNEAFEANRAGIALAESNRLKNATRILSPIDIQKEKDRRAEDERIALIRKTEKETHARRDEELRQLQVQRERERREEEERERRQRREEEEERARRRRDEDSSSSSSSSIFDSFGGGSGGGFDGGSSGGGGSSDSW